MKDINNFTCSCFCVVDPELKQIGNDKKMCVSRIGINRINEGVDWFGIKIFDKPGEVFAEYVKKGSQLILSGRIQIEEYNEKLYPTIYVSDFRFINSSNGSKNKQEKKETVTSSQETQSSQDNINEEDIPF